MDYNKIKKKLIKNKNTKYLSDKYYYEIYSKPLNDLIQLENIYVIKKKLEQKNVITSKSLDSALYTKNIEIIKLVLKNGGRMSKNTINICIALQNIEIIKIIKCIDKLDYLNCLSLYEILTTTKEECILTYMALYNISYHFKNDICIILHEIKNNDLMWGYVNNEVVKIVLMHIYTNDINENIKLLEEYNIEMTETEFRLYYNEYVDEFNKIIKDTKKHIFIDKYINDITNLIPEICYIIIDYLFFINWTKI